MGLVERTGWVFWTLFREQGKIYEIVIFRFKILCRENINVGFELEVHIDYHLVLFPYMIKKYNMEIHTDRNKETDNIVLIL